MNGWDLFTWFNAIVLITSTLLIFIFFLRDAREFIDRQGEDDE